MRRTALCWQPELGLAAALLLTACVCGPAAGCAAAKALEQPDKRDMSVLAEGVPRTHVIGELGTPKWSSKREGGTVDVFAFKQGYTPTTKAARAAVHVAADLFTLGLWEVAGLPAETLMNGTEVQVEVHYGFDEVVERVVVIKGEKAVHPKPLFAKREPRRPKDYRPPF